MAALNAALGLVAGPAAARCAGLAGRAHAPAAAALPKTSVLTTKPLRCACPASVALVARSSPSRRPRAHFRCGSLVTPGSAGRSLGKARSGSVRTSLMFRRRTGTAPTWPSAGCVMEATRRSGASPSAWPATTATRTPCSRAAGPSARPKKPWTALAGFTCPSRRPGSAPCDAPQAAAAKGSGAASSWAAMRVKSLSRSSRSSRVKCQSKGSGTAL
jgi:hypothetical protein